MRIQKISTYIPPRQNFKGYGLYEDYESDYGTYYNQLTIKEAVVCASIVSGLMAVGGFLATNGGKISKFCLDAVKKCRQIIGLE